MKYSAAILALAAAVASQSIADLPSCSLQCVATGVTGVGCDLTDFECSCQKSAELTPAITPCVQSACPDAADQAKVISTLEGICAAAGFPIDVPEPSASATAEPEPESTSVAPTIETSIPTPSATDIVITDPTFTVPPTYPTAPAEESSCVVVTETVTVTEPTGSTPVAPYPTTAVGTGVPVYPTGTGAYTSSPPLFTGAAAAVNVPAGIAGVLGLAAYLL